MAHTVNAFGCGRVDDHLPFEPTTPHHQAPHELMAEAERGTNPRDVTRQARERVRGMAKPKVVAESGPAEGDLSRYSAWGRPPVVRDAAK